MSDSPELILASESRSRARMLEAAGVPFTALAAKIDEDAIKEAMLAEKAAPAEIAETLAELKALRVAARAPRALVLGADQVMVLDGVIHSKPADMAAARAQLRAMSGKPHELISAAVVARGDRAIWRHVSRARLVVRPLDDAFIDHYLERCGEGILRNVGCYEIEGLGAQLFSRIDGDPFVIQGLPLLPLMAFLREHKILPA
ncbi:MAG TPA: Maf family nucleotide pyrophosphatase [Sphingomonadales bacterium]